MEYGSGAAARTSIAAPGGPPLPRTSRRSERAKPSRTRNQLLDSLGRAERAAVLADCEPMQLRFAAVLCEPGDRIRYAYFPQAGAIARKWLLEKHGVVIRGCMSQLGPIAIPFQSWEAVRDNPFFAANAGIVLHSLSPGREELGLLAAIVATCLLAGLLPAWRASRLALADGLSPRL